jgi:putative phage-type endonuclease
MQQGTQEWLDFRKSRIGSSDAAVILGISPWKTPYQLWQEKLDLSIEKEASYAMKRGIEMEEKARHYYECKKGSYYFPMVMTHDTHPWMIASLDGMTIDRRNAVEIKCPGNITHKIALEGNVPEHYYAQLQHLMYVCNLQKIDYFSFDGKEGVIIEVHRDAKYQTELFTKESEFYCYMQNVIPPPLSERDYISHDDSSWEKACVQWLDAKKLLEEAENKENEARQAILFLSDDHNAMGCGVKVQKLFRRGNVDYNSIPALKAVNLEDYRKKPSIYFRISEF